MNQSKLTVPGETGTTQEKRRDGKQREMVNHAVCLQRDNSTLCALEYLKSNAIPAAVIERVLLEPDRRRIPTAV